MKRLSICLIFLSFVLIFACKNPTSPTNNPIIIVPSITSVIINDKIPTPNVAKGSQKQFNATVTVTGGADKSIAWSIIGSGGSTSINIVTGLLTVGIDETSEIVTVKATSVFDYSKSDTVMVNLTPYVDPNLVDLDPPGNVTLSKDGKAAWAPPASGETSITSYRVELIKDSENIIKTVTVNKGSQYEIDFHNEINSAFPGTYLVQVRSVGDPETHNPSAAAASSSVIFDKLVIFTIWLVGDMTRWGANDPPLGEEMTREADGTYTWSGSVDEESYFRFSLTDTTDWDDVWFGNWLAPPDSEVDQYDDKIIEAENNVAFFTYTSGYSTTENTWLIETAGYYTFILDPSAMKLRVEIPEPIVTDVTISSYPKTVGTGKPYGDFAAILNGTNIESVKIIWSVSGNSDTNTKFGTGANYNVLTVGSSETGPLTVMASAGGKSDSVIINIGETGSTIINLKFRDFGDIEIGINISPDAVTGEYIIYKTGDPWRITYTVINPGDHTYNWYMDSILFNPGTSESSYNFDAGQFAAGKHTVMLLIDNKWSNSDLGFRIKLEP